MGCAQAGGGGGKPGVDNNRRRLSVGQADASSVETSQDATEADRGFLTQLDAETIVDMLADSQGRKMSIGSDNDAGKTSFANKTIKEEGDKMDLQNQGFGYTCRKGLKPEAPNQDSWAILQMETTSLYAVFDGHGNNGHHVSNFVKDNLPKLILKDQRFQDGSDYKGLCIDAFKKMQALVSTADRMKKLQAQMSGTTATLCIHSKPNDTFKYGKLLMAHVADSTAVIAKALDDKPGGKGRSFQGVALTRDHKPSLKDERQRIEKAGGRVVFDGYANHRVYAKNARYPGLNMSRCIGDLLGHQDCGITCEPEVSEHVLTPQDLFLLVCSDGVWEFTQAQEAVEIVSQHGFSKAMMAADKLAKEAWDRWIRE